MSFLKYVAYRDSGIEWLGVVPKHWDISPLKAVASCNDEVLPEGTDGERLIEYVEISGVDEGRGITGTETLTFGAAPSRARRVVRDGDVLISTVRTYLRAIATVSNPPSNLIASTGFAAIRPRRVHPGFLGYMLRCEYLISEVIARSVGISYPAINASDLMRLKGPIPSIEEQAAIATFLDRETAKINALVEEQRRLIELLKEKRQAVISQAVTKGLNANVPMKDSGVEWIGKVPKHWEVKQVRQFTEILRGKFTHRPRNDPAFYDGSHPFIQTGDVTGATREIASFTQTLNDRGVGVSKQFPRGTLVMTIAANIGDVAVLDFPAYFPDSIVGLVPRSGVALMFLFYLMKAMKQPLERNATVSTQMNLNVGQIGSLAAPCPPIEEQLKIVAMLDAEIASVDLLASEAKTAMSLLGERRTALISAAVTGKIDVRNVVLPAAKVEELAT